MACFYNKDKGEKNMEEKLKYGVNIDLANDTKKHIAKELETDEKRVLNKVGAFSSLFDIRFPEYKNPVLVLKTEEPGSKQLLAMEHDRIESVCFDMINHLINDCIVMGATPLAIQDAIICGKLDSNIIKRCVKAMAQACRAQECVLTGGETSEQPGVINEGTYILTSSIVGIVDQEDIIDGSKIAIGDCVLAVESSGIHTNGYTLVRDILSRHKEIENETVGNQSFMDAVLEPHRCYYKAVKDLFPGKKIHGLAHITGGGIKENLNRILPDTMDAEIDLSKYNPLPVFKILKKYGNVEDEEMIRTFNLGVGMTVVTDPQYKEEIIRHFQEQGINCYEIGTIVSGNKKVNTINTLDWEKNT